MEPNSLCRQKFNIHSTKYPANSWLSNLLITEYVKSVNIFLFDKILPDGHNHEIGKRNQLTSLGPIERDQKNHYDYNNPKNIKTSTLYRCRSLVTYHTHPQIMQSIYGVTFA